MYSEAESFLSDRELGAYMQQVRRMRISCGNHACLLRLLPALWED